MFMDILVAGLLALVSFRSGMEYQNYRSHKAEIEALEKRIEALKEDKPKEKNSTQKEMMEMWLKGNLEEILKEENPEEAIKEWIAQLEGSKPVESGNVE